jgi:hypothetical protein
MRPLAPFALLLALAMVSTSSEAQFANVDACSLLTPSEAGKAIDVTVDKGQHLVATSKGECIWTDGPSTDLDHRRVTLSMMAQPAFDHMKSSAELKPEPVAGVGDEAYFVTTSGAGPILIARKGSACFQLKVLNGFKVKPPLKLDEQKARELVLGKAAAART